MSTAAFRSINPKNNQLHRTFQAISNTDLEQQIERSYQRFRENRNQGHSSEALQNRFGKLGKLKEILGQNRSHYAGLMT